MSPNEKIRAVVISPAIAQPRFHRRVEAILDVGVRPVVYSFRRGLYEGNRYPSAAQVIDLGRVEDRKYFARLPKLSRALLQIRRTENTFRYPPAFVLAFGFDAAVLALAAFPRAVPLIYEVGDLRGGDAKGALAWALRSVERRITRRATTLIVTSPGFVSEHYAKLDPACVSKAHIVENKLSRWFLAVERRSQPVSVANDRRIRIGFVGNLRYPRTFLPLLDAIGARPGQYELHVYGDGHLRNEVEAAAQRHDNVHYHGAFRNPHDLEEIYRTIDINYVVYDDDDPNVRVALPNKLYESAFFGVPIVAASRTVFAQRVRALDIGFSVNTTESDFVGRLLDSIGRDEVELCSRSALKVPTADLVEQPEKSSGWIPDLGLAKTHTWSGNVE